MTMASFTHYKRLPVLGLAVAALCLVWLAWRAPAIGLTEMVLVLIVTGIGGGVQFPVTTVAVQNAVDPRDMGVATGVLAFLRALGSSIGIAIIGAVGAAGGVTVAMAGQSVGAAVATTPGSAFSGVFLTAAACTALGCAMLALMPELPLRGSKS